MTAKMIFGSLAEFVETVASGKPLRGSCSISNKADARWDMGLGFNGAVALGRTGGWAEGAAMIRQGMFELASDNARALGGTTELAVVGARPCVPAYLAGSPASMWRHTDENEGTRRVLRVGVHVGRSAYVTAEEILNRGVAVLSLIDDIEASGVRVELWAVWRQAKTSAAPDSHQCDIMIKGAGDTWNPEAAAFALCHPAFSRRLCFRSMEMPGGGNIPGYGLNTRTSYPDDFDVYVPRMTYSYGFKTRKQAFATVAKLYDEQRGAQ